MRWQPIDIISDEYADDNRHWSAQHCVNYLPVPAERPGTRSRWQLRQAPGLKPLVRIISEHGTPDVEAGPIRGMREVEGKLFVVAGTTLYQITNGLVAVPYGTIPGVGRVSMAHNQRGLGNELLIATGASGYVFNTNTLILQKVTDDAYPGAFVAAYIDSYIAQVEPQGRYWFHSDLADALSYNSLDRYEAEGQPDRIISLHVSHREVLIFGRETIEPYVNEPSGDGTGPFQRANNTVVECGCASRFSVASLDNSVLFLDDKRIVRRLDGYTPVRISTQPIEQALAECSADQIASAFAFVWEDRGHKVYYLTVPGRFTFGFDVLSQRWHRRMTKGMDRWRLSDLVYWNGKWVGGDYQTGRLYELDWKYALDGQDSEGQPLEYVRRSGSGYLSANENRLRVDGCAVVCRVGGDITVPVEFPEQPIGPSIAGTAPDATAGMAYSYAYTLTAGDAPIAGCDLFNSNLPSDWRISPTGVLTGTAPLELTSYTFSIRVRDANGLYATLADTIAVTTAGAMAIPTTQVQLFEINGGGAWNIAEQITKNDFAAITDATEPWARIFCWSYTANGGEVPPESRCIVYDAINQGGSVVYDSLWRGNPANQAAMTAALATAGLSAYSGTIQETPITDYGTYDSYLYASDPFVLPTNFGTYSGRSVAYRSQSRLDRSIHLERPNPANIPVGATKVESLPGCYMAAGQLYRCDWVEIPE